eukprot:TRINITY_DN9899_c0_g1_i1.p1 TRINITY_DN9899_c0_g1~~TRINITY_DN9899_c0_g1_i1.p1  ORF type:complete len:297 (+),score=64.70 TRINITY_DN9899_c0_g1_i1:66-893(+)
MLPCCNDYGVETDVNDGSFPAVTCSPEQLSEAIAALRQGWYPVHKFSTNGSHKDKTLVLEESDAGAPCLRYVPSNKKDNKEVVWLHDVVEIRGSVGNGPPPRTRVFDEVHGGAAGPVCRSCQCFALIHRPRRLPHAKSLNMGLDSRCWNATQRSLFLQALSHVAQEARRSRRSPPPSPAGSRRRGGPRSAASDVPSAEGDARRPLLGAAAAAESHPRSLGVAAATAPPPSHRGSVRSGGHAGPPPRVDGVAGPPAPADSDSGSSGSGGGGAPGQR